MSGLKDHWMSPPHRGWIKRKWRTLCLFLNIVYRVDQTEHRMGPPGLAWDVASGINDKCDCFDCYAYTSVPGSGRRVRA